MNNNKILTVSYGTFSCTLEGFEDSFEMMKVIAEYFRDLAADDRFFGAEPAQLDAETLANLAQRETSRRVEASERDGHFVLSAADETVTTAAVTAAIATGAAAAGISSTSTDASEMYEDDVYAEDASAKATGADESIFEETGFEKMEAAALPTAAPAAGSIAEKLQRIRAVVKQADADVEEEPYYTEALIETESDDEPQLEADAPSAEDVVEATEKVEQDFIAASTEDIMAAAEIIEPDVIDEPAEEETDVVETNLADETEDAPELTNVFEDDTAEEDTSDEGVLVLDTPADDLQADDIETEVEGVEELVAALNPTLEEDIEAQKAAEHELENIEAQFAAADAEANIETDTASDVEEIDDTTDDVADVAPEETAQQEPTKDDLGKILDALASDTSDADETQVETSEDDIAEETGTTDDVLKLISQIETPSEEDSKAEEETAPKAERKRVRVIKVKRADIDEAVSEGTLELTEDDAVANDDAAASSLSETEEAELMADLAEVEAELTDDAASAAETKATKPAIMGDAADTLPALADDLEEADAKDVSILDTDVNRLMDEADEQMDEPESANRRSAFQALKAAVLARKADKQLSNEDGEDDDVDAYRSDLAKVVQPRRPEATTRTERPTPPPEAGSSPLRLVAEQRVSGSEDETEAPVTPRRVASEGTTPAEEAGSFEDYCAELGAHDLSDVLEAAASYLTFIEGRKQFSRPQLMMKARQIEKEDFSREDGLRSFGQLLRSGKIEKIRGGRFAVTPDIGYKPDQRAAG
ncbi:MAG: hypothetical protein ABJ246_06985 [Paracoccaceae bacterium]